MGKEEDRGIKTDTIGINFRRHKELIHRLFELVESSGTGPFMSTTQLIDLIADEPTFSKKECVYLGLYLATMHHDDESISTTS